jgi:hypothetical protein
MKAIRSISAVLLAILVLVSSTSFMVGMHICMGHIQSIAVFSKAEGCGMDKDLAACHQTMKTPCCEDDAVIHKAEDFKASAANFQLYVPVAIDIELPLVFISEIVPSSFISQIKYYNYDPPLRSCDLTVEHQVFLI